MKDNTNHPRGILDESEVGSDAQDQQATEAVDESNRLNISIELNSMLIILGSLATQTPKDPVQSL